MSDLSVYNDVQLDRINRNARHAAEASTATAAAAAANAYATNRLVNEVRYTRQAIEQLQSQLKAAEQQRYSQQLMANITQAQQFVNSQPVPNDKTKTGLNYLFGGNGIAQNPLIAYIYLKQAANEGSLWANYYMGNLAMAGTVYPQNHRLAISYYQVFVSIYIQQFCKTVDDVNNIASRYFDGEECEQNRYVSFLFWKQIEEYQNSITFDNLGNCYQHGFGTQQNTNKAIQCYEVAAKSDDDYALYRLGNIYWYPDYQKENNELALEYFIKAASEGNEDSKRFLNQIYKENIHKIRRYFITLGILIIGTLVCGLSHWGDHIMGGMELFILLFIVTIIYGIKGRRSNKFSFNIIKLFKNSRFRSLTSYGGVPYIYKLTKDSVITEKGNLPDAEATAANTSTSEITS